MPRRGKSAKPLRGYTRINKNRWRTSSGKEITDYEYRSRIARKQGWDNASQASKFRNTQTWLKWKYEVLKNEENFDSKGKYIGPDLSYRGELMRDAYDIQERAKEGKTSTRRKGEKIRADETELGRLLIAMGRISEDAEWVY